MAKGAVREAMANVENIPTDNGLPLEDASVTFGDVKQTSDVTKELRFHVGRQKARKLYSELSIMDNTTFDSVAWLDLQWTLERKPWMYQLWFSKQGSGYCGTGEMLHR